MCCWSSCVYSSTRLVSQHCFHELNYLYQPKQSLSWTGFFFWLASPVYEVSECVIHCTRPSQLHPNLDPSSRRSAASAFISDINWCSWIFWPWCGAEKTLSPYTWWCKLHCMVSSGIIKSTSSIKTPNRSAGQQRVLDTASYFLRGYLSQGNYLTNASMNRGSIVALPDSVNYTFADSLTSSNGCPRYSSGDNGSVNSNTFRATYQAKVAQRLNRFLDGIVLTPSDIGVMQDLCGFQAEIDGDTRFCDVFTREFSMFLDSYWFDERYRIRMAWLRICAWS